MDCIIKGIAYNFLIDYERKQTKITHWPIKDNHDPKLIIKLDRAMSEVTPHNLVEKITKLLEYS